jgi:hypothetical protein
VWKRTRYKEKHRSFAVASKEIFLKVNADETKHTVMSGDQNAGRSQSF